MSFKALSFSAILQFQRKFGYYLESMDPDANRAPDGSLANARIERGPCTIATSCEAGIRLAKPTFDSSSSSESLKSS